MAHPFSRILGNTTPKMQREPVPSDQGQWHYIVLQLFLFGGMESPFLKIITDCLLMLICFFNPGYLFYIMYCVCS